MQSEQVIEVEVIHQETILLSVLWFLIWASKFRVPSRGCICVLCCVSSTEELYKSVRVRFICKAVLDVLPARCICLVT